MRSETTTACVRLLVFFRIRHGTFPYGVEYDANTISQTPTTHDTNTCVKLTIVTHLSFSERIAIANLSFSFQSDGKLNALPGTERKVGGICSEKLRGKRAERKVARMKHKAARVRSRLNELTFGTFNVRTAAVNGVNGIGHFDAVLRTCAAKGCYVIRLMETKRDGTSEIVASGYRVYFSDDCSGVKGRERQHGVGLAIKEEIVKNTGKDGIAIECIGARLMKARVAIKANFATFVVAYAPIGEAPEGQKAKYMAALNSSVALVPAQEYVFDLKDPNSKKGKRCWGGEEADSKVLGAYGRDVLNENSKLLLGFTEDNKLALLNTLICTLKGGVSYTF